MTHNPTCAAGVCPAQAGGLLRARYETGVGAKGTEPPMIATATTGSANEPHIYTAGKLLESFFPPIEEIMRNTFVAGRSCVIGGAYGIGKTTLAIQMGAGLAAGECVFGRDVARPYRVGYFDLELGGAEFQGRLQLARSRIQDTVTLDENFIYVDASTESDLFGKIKLQPDNKVNWLLADLLQEYGIEIAIIDNVSLAVPGNLSEPDVCMQLQQNLGKLRQSAKALKLTMLPAHLVKPSRDGDGPPSLLNDPRGWLTGIRGSGKLLDHITQRFGFDQEQDGTGQEYYVLNGISSHRLISPLVLEQDVDTRQFSVSKERSRNLSLILTPAERKVWDSLPMPFKYASDVKKYKGTGQRMFKKAQEHGLITEVEAGLWKKTLEG